MKESIKKGIFTGIVLMIVILIFTIIDHFLHGLQDKWSVPERYFRNKIPFGFFLVIIGLFLATRVQNIWFKSLILAGFVSVVLQLRYYYEGYPVGFVTLFLVFHFLIIYPLSVGMFKIFNKYLS